jgi:Uma2 family endonuclease
MAAVPTTTPLLTADDLMAMPDDGYRYELVRGELVRLPMSAHQSSIIAMRIAARLIPFVEAGNLGNVAGADGAYIFARDPYTVRIPDLSFVSDQRLPPVETWNKFLELAPDLAVEVVSPSDTANEVHEKVMEYLAVGVRLIWVVHPAQRTVTVYPGDRTGHVRTEGDILDGGTVLPGFTLAVEDIFSVNRR